MITKSESFKTEDGQLFASENEAKLHELEIHLLKETGNPEQVRVTIETLQGNIDATIEILTGSVRVRGKYNRKAKATPTTDKTKP